MDLVANSSCAFFTLVDDCYCFYCITFAVAHLINASISACTAVVTLTITAKTAIAVIFAYALLCIATITAILAAAATRGITAFATALRKLHYCSCNFFLPTLSLFTAQLIVTAIAPRQPLAFPTTTTNLCCSSQPPQSTAAALDNHHHHQMLPQLAPLKATSLSRHHQPHCLQPI